MRRAAVVALLAGTVSLSGCSFEHPTPVPAPIHTGVIVSASPKVTQPSPRTPTPTPTQSVSAEKPLACRKATPAERWLVTDSTTAAVWAVDAGGGWRMVSAMAKLPGGTAEPNTMVSNGERHNYVYGRTPEPFKVRILPVVLVDGFDAMDAVERCARRGHA